MVNFFDLWNWLKQRLHKRSQAPYFKKGEIRWASIGQNVGSESFGKGENFARPVLILQKFYNHSAFVIPLSTKIRENDYYLSFCDKAGNVQCALIPQARYLDGRRIYSKVSSVSEKTLKDVLQHLFKILE